MLRSEERTEIQAVLVALFTWATLLLGAKRAQLPWDPLLIGALIRLPLLLAPSLLSDDLGRYQAEGEAIGAGYNPFRWSPVALAFLPDAAGSAANHGHLTAIYPPLAQGYLRLLSALSLGTTPFRAACVLADLAILVMLRRSPGGTRAALLFALHPLAALESAIGGHLDTPAVALALAAVLAADRGRPESSGALWALGVGFKYLPILLLPHLIRRQARAGRLQPWFIGIVAVALPTLAVTGVLTDRLPFFSSSFGVYAKSWSFNPFLGPLVAVEHLRPLALGGACVAALGALLCRSSLQALFLCGATFALLSPTAHPWYLVWWLVPALALGYLRLASALAFYPLAYAVLLTLQPDGRWSVEPWLWPISWGTVLTALLVQFVPWSGAKPGRSPTTPAAGTVPPPNAAR